MRPRVQSGRKPWYPLGCLWAQGPVPWTPTNRLPPSATVVSPPPAESPDPDSGAAEGVRPLRALLAPAGGCRPRAPKGHRLTEAPLHTCPALRTAPPFPEHPGALIGLSSFPASVDKVTKLRRSDLNRYQRGSSTPSSEGGPPKPAPTSTNVRAATSALPPPGKAAQEPPEPLEVASISPGVGTL